MSQSRMKLMVTIQSLYNNDKRPHDKGMTKHTCFPESYGQLVNVEVAVAIQVELVMEYAP